jgi:hypothetical protein
MNMWDLTGFKVTGKYLDEITVTGRVRMSRVKFGGTVSHHIDLDKPMMIYGNLRDTVIVDHKNVEQISDH